LQALKRLFCFPVAQACLLAVLTVLTVRGRFDDPDLWWHLKMGQVIYSTHSIPAHDLFSYTTNHQALVPQEWLAELSLAPISRAVIPALWRGSARLRFCWW
jgi:hypothetical protein